MCKHFMDHFLASKNQPKLVESWVGIRKKIDESQRSYFEMFNKDPIELKDTTKKMKRYFLSLGAS